MIVFLKSWCEGILVAVMISVLIESILPEGNHKKYVKVVIGIYLIFTILSPFLGKLNTNLEFNTEFHLPTVETSGEVDSKNIQELYKNGIKETLKNSIEEEFDCQVQELEILYDENYEEIQEIHLLIHENGIAEIEKVEIGNSIETKESSQRNQSIKKYIMENYDMEESKIFINERRRLWRS